MRVRERTKQGARVTGSGGKKDGERVYAQKRQRESERESERAREKERVGER